MSDDIETEKQLLKFAKRLGEMFDPISSEAKKLWDVAQNLRHNLDITQKDTVGGALERGGWLAKIYQDGQAQKAVVADMMARHALRSSNEHENFGKLSAKVLSLTVHAHNIEEALAKTHTSVAEMVGQVFGEIANLRDDVSKLTARLQEHALHRPEVRARVLALTGGKCFYCDVELVEKIECEADGPRHFHIDHVVSKSNGGPDHTDNYVPACRTCNIQKGDKSLLEFMAWRRALAAGLSAVDGGRSTGTEGA